MRFFELNQCYIGDCRERLSCMIDAGIKVQMCVTSPPYWGLRDYGISPSIWGGDSACEHVWGDEISIHRGGPTGPSTGVAKRKANLVRDNTADRRAGQFCACGAWLGTLGLEPDYRMYIEHIVEVMDLVREVLADDGTLWLNMGDSYASSPGQRKTTDKVGAKQLTNAGSNSVGSRTAYGLKPKDLCMMPARVAIALQEADWWVRQDIIWHKPNPMPESITDRCTKAHEYIFLLSKSQRYYYDADAIKEPVSPGHPNGPQNKSHKGVDAYNDGASEHRTKAGLVDYAKNWKQPDGWDTTVGEGGHGFIHKRGRDKGKTRDLGPKLQGERDDLGKGHMGGARMGRGAGWRDDPNTSPDNRNKRSVWTVSTEPYPDAHFATFPRKLIEPCILAGSRKGDIVLDPFMGSGTTAQVAEQLGRQWIGCEMNPEYLLLQRQRLQQRSLEL